MIKLKPEILSRIKNARLLLVGGSAGSFAPLQMLIDALPADFPIPVVVLIHRGKKFPALLASLLERNSRVKIKEATDREKPQAGTVYIAPANYHLLIDWDGCFSLDVSEPVWFCRPSIDVLFESAADSCPGASIAVLLSGANADGVHGIVMIEKSGGYTLVQSPEEAEFATMPAGAVKRNAANTVFWSAEIGEILSVIQSTIKGNSQDE